MGKRFTILACIIILGLVLTGCEPGVTINFDPERVTVDLGKSGEDLPREIKFQLAFMGMGTLGLNNLEIEIKDTHNILEGEEEFDSLAEILEDLFTFLDDETPYRENDSYFFRQELDLTVPVLPFFGAEDEANQLPGNIVLRREALENLEGRLLAGEELKMNIATRFYGQGRVQAFSSMLLKIIGSGN